ncbi:neutral/alkaline non-lysosomal ceramidase N-terminal domain-containing protein [Candidatus Latescibacterota bacterium]
MRKINISIRNAAILLIGSVVIITVMMADALSSENRTLSVGVAKVNITPQTPIPMSGYGSRKDPFTGVHDDLFSRVVVFSDGENKAVIITADIIGFSHDFLEKFTDRLERETGITKEFILLAPAHNHGGPVTRVYNRAVSPEVLAYVDVLEEKMAGAVKEAINDMQPVLIGGGTGECLMNINRRALHPKDGIALGRNPYGPCDHEVGVIRIDDTKGNIVSLLYNWPCHGTTTGPKNYQITGDWPGAASRYIETELDDKVIAPVTIGASGDINPIYGPHIDFESESRFYSYGVESIGIILGKEVIKVAEAIRVSGAGSINALQRIVTLPGKTDDSKLQQPDTFSESGLKIRLTVLKIGNIIMAGVSGEVFNEIGVELKKQSPYANTFMVTHCNGSSGYLITDKAYEEGGYEARSTRAKSGAEKALIDNLLDMINEL